MKIYMYEKQSLKEHSTFANSIEDLNSRISILYPTLVDIEYIATESRVEYPIVVDNVIRNKTREERIVLDNALELLLDSEIVENGVINIVPIPERIIKPKWVSPEWIESITLNEAKEFKRIEFKSQRDIENCEPFLYQSNGYKYDADLDSKNKLFQAQQLGAGASNNIQWITYDNQISLLNSQDLSNIVTGIATREQELFAKFSNKYSSVLNCETVDEVKKITW